MSFRECMANAEKDGDITPQQAIEVRDLFDAVRGSLAADLGGQAAETAAARETFMHDLTGQAQRLPGWYRRTAQRVQRHLKWSREVCRRNSSPSSMGCSTNFAAP